MAHNLPILTAEIFSIDGRDNYKGYYDPSVDWNGFACPYFTKEEGMKMTKDMNNLHFVGDRFVCDDDEEVFDAMEVETQDGKLTLYPIGAFYWVWSVHEFSR